MDKNKMLEVLQTELEEGSKDPLLLGHIALLSDLIEQDK